MLLVDSAGGREFSFNFFFAFIASSLVISSFLINLFVIFDFSFDLILLSIYDCDIGFETVSAFNSSDGFNFLFSSFTYISRARQRVSLSQADSETFYLVTLPASLGNRIREPRHGRAAPAEVPSRVVTRGPGTWFEGRGPPLTIPDDVMTSWLALRPSLCTRAR